MVTCKDCVHHEVCFNYVIGDEVERCKRFKNIADVVKVKHSRWEGHTVLHGSFDGSVEEYIYRCSECHAGADKYGVEADIYEEPPTHILHYCPNCGAKMDGERTTTE